MRKFTNDNLTKGVPLLGSLPYFKQDPFQFLYELSNLSDFEATTFGPLKIKLISDPKMVEEVLHEKSKYFGRSELTLPLRRALGNGLVASDGDEWLKQRRLIKSAFLSKFMARYYEDMREVAKIKLVDWKNIQSNKETVDFSKEFMDATFKIICKTMFTDLPQGNEEEIHQAMPKLLNYIDHYNKNLIKAPLFIPTKINQDFKSGRASIIKIAKEVLDNHVASPGKYNDLLTYLLNAKDPEMGSSLSKENILDQVITFFLAGHETTAIMLSWTLYLITTHPDALRKIQTEINEHIACETPSFDEITKLIYTSNVLKESNRLYPPVWLLDRKATTNLEIGGNEVKKGDILFISPYLLHRDPKFWEQAQGFLPERFEIEEVNPFTYLPFGAGPRRCIGQEFAFYESLVILATLLKNFEPELSTMPKVEIEPMLTLRMKNGLWCSLK